MFTLVIYDIESDKVRNRIIEACKDKGLSRIQFSAFSGDLSPAERRELFLRLEEILGREAGNVQLFPICEEDLKGRKELDNSDGEK